MCEIFYILANATLKFSIGYFYLRVAIQRWHVWTIKLLMAGTILFSAVYFFLVVFQCTPGKPPMRTFTEPEIANFSVTFELVHGINSACSATNLL
jgi:hypothetical protein